MNTILVLIRVFADISIMVAAAWALIYLTVWSVSLPIFVAYFFLVYYTEFVLTEEDLK